MVRYQNAMKERISKTLILVLIVVIFSAFYPRVEGAAAVTADLQAQIDDANAQIDKITQQIAEYQAELGKLGSDKKTLNAAIYALDLKRKKISAQISATQGQIKSTSLQLQQLNSRIDSAEKNITVLEDDLASTLRKMNFAYTNSIVTQLISAPTLADFWQEMKDEGEVQKAIFQKTLEIKDKKKQLSVKQNSVQAKKDDLSAQNKALTAQQSSLTITAQSKSQLLIQTKNQESNYQKLLAQAKAQLKRFSQFTKNAGGAKLLPNQTVCDTWGCYYNQRDTAWGAQSLNGTEYTLASDGCLVTSMAMVMTHYGYRNVTPASINANPDNFASYYPAFLMYTISVNGVSATRVATTIDSSLAAGTPLVIGMNVGGGTHFVVLVSGSNGNYIMRDPYLAGGKDMNFTDHYSVKGIYSITKVVIGG